MDVQEQRALQIDLERQTAPAWHIPDEARVGVLAGLEQYETWLQAHFLHCNACRSPIIDLMGEIQGCEVISDEGEVLCAQARNALMHYLESDRRPPFTLLQHILACDTCCQTFYEPAKAAAILEFDPDEVGEAG